MAGTTISKASSPVERTAGLINSTFRSISSTDWLNRKFRAAVGHFGLFHAEKAVARHARHHLFVGVYLADVPQAGDQEAVIRRSNHLFERGFASGKHQVHRSFAVLVRQRESVACRLFLRPLGAGPAVDQISRHAAFDQADPLPRHSFPVKRRAKLAGVINVIPNRNVFAEKRLAHPVVQAGTLVFQGSRGKIVKKESHQIEHRSRFEDHRVFVGR